VNFPEQEYKDVFGGTLDNALMAEYEDHKIQLFKGESTAMINHQADARKASLRASKDEIDGLNKKEEWLIEKTITVCIGPVISSSTY